MISFFFIIIYSIMTIFKSKKNGKLYMLHQNKIGEDVVHTAVPYKHDGRVQKGVDPEGFTLHEKIGPNTKGFL